MTRTVTVTTDDTDDGEVDCVDNSDDNYVTMTVKITRSLFRVYLVSSTALMWQGQDPDEERRLPDGWDCISVPRPAKSYLLSPGVDSEGKTRKRIKVFDPHQLALLQRPSPGHPRGRFQELQRIHFPWVKEKQSPPKRVQVINNKNHNIAKLLSPKT